MFWYIVLCIIVLALAYVFFSYRKVKAMEEGTAEMA